MLKMFKYFLISALLSTSFTVIAANQPVTEDDDIVPPPMPPSGFYVGGDLGYASRPWGNVVSFNHFDLSNNDGGFTGGFNFGYQMTPVFSAEMGWINLPTLKVSSEEAQLNKIESWFLYFALKGAAPLYRNLYALGKVGIAYSNNENDTKLKVNSPINADHSDYWTPYFAAGLEYDFELNLSINCVAAYLPGYQTAITQPNEFSTPNTYIFTLGAAYKFY